MFRWILLGFSIISTLLMNGQSQTETTGPEKGTLVVVGGGGMTPEITAQFMELAGGNDAHIVVVPTASGEDSYNQDGNAANQFRALGAKTVTVIHTNDRTEADSEDFTKALDNATAVWFGGGRQWRLVDAYAKTLTETKFWKVLERGGVIGGSSAGATIQGSYLARGDTKNNQIMMGDHEAGFGFIKNIAIDQHVLARNRQFDLFDILKEKPELLGIGLDERTAIIVQGDVFEVVGASYVLIYDQQFWSREGSDLKNLPDPANRFYFLRPGDRYNMKNRQVVE